MKKEDLAKLLRTNLDEFNEYVAEQRKIDKDFKVDLDDVDMSFTDVKAYVHWKT